MWRKGAKGKGQIVRRNGGGRSDVAQRTAGASGEDVGGGMAV